MQRGVLNQIDRPHKTYISLTRAKRVKAIENYTVVIEGEYVSYLLGAPIVNNYND